MTPRPESAHGVSTPSRPKASPGTKPGKATVGRPGSATTWVTGVYDPETNTVYWGTGNPGPDWNGDVRKGDNLYSDCLIALDPDTGAKKWHFQYTPHDMNDWDSTQTPTLVDGTVAGQSRKMVVLANRNGFYYALDRVTGKFIAGQALREANLGDRSGRNRPAHARAGAEPTVEGKLIWPSLGGGSNWYSSTYSPENGPLLCQREGRGGHLSQGRGRVSRRSALQRRRPERLQRRGALWRGARAGSGDGQASLGVQAAPAVARGSDDDRRRPGVRIEHDFFLRSGRARAEVCCGASRPAVLLTPIRSLI